MTTRSRVLLPMLAALWALGCVGLVAAPNERINSAQKELDKARKVQADLYAPAQYNAAERTLRRARQESDQGNHRAAERSAKNAEKEAKAAVDAVDKNKARMRDGVKRTIRDTGKTLDQARKEYENAQKLRVPEGELATAHSTLVSAETDLKQADKILDTGDVITARDKATDVQKKAARAQKDIRYLVAAKGAPHKRTD